MDIAQNAVVLNGLQCFIEKIVNVLFSCFLKTEALDNYVIGVCFFNREINFSIEFGGQKTNLFFIKL